MIDSLTFIGKDEIHVALLPDFSCFLCFTAIEMPFSLFSFSQDTEQKATVERLLELGQNVHLAF